jgi:phage terminase large subunit
MKNVQLNPKYHSVFESPSRYHICTGGRGSGKSFAINTFLVLLTYEKGHKILFTRYTMTSASMSIIPEFLEKLDLMGIGGNFTVTKTEIINNLTGSSIFFSGIKTASGDQTAKLKSIQGVTTFVLDEAEELTDEESFDKIDYSVRAMGIQNRCILILNPTTKEHWIYQRFFQNRGIPDGHNGENENVNYVHTTYLDNRMHLSESFVAQVEDMRTRRPDKYKHQILGGWLDRAEGVIFTHWRIGEFDDNQDTIFGLDFGFSRDESVLTEIAIDKTRKIIWIKEHFYKAGMSTSNIFEMCRRIAGKQLIVCDNSEPRLISELKTKGLNITPTIKRKGSILTGIALMQDYNIVIDKESINTIKEFNNYAWKLKGSIPQDNWNHSVDASRYAIQYLLTRSVPKGMYVIK